MYTLYGGELSYFTRKLEAALDFYGLEYRFVDKGQSGQAAEIEARSGTHQVPVLQTPENWMLGDTTPILQLLDARIPARALFPSGPLGVLTHIVEEFFDEWVARTMVHTRWHYEESATYAALKMTHGNKEAAERIANWGPRACRATGTDSPLQQKAAEDEFSRLLAAMSAQLKETRFLLGDRPTAVDCIVLGALRAHINQDPWPKRELMTPFPDVAEWADGATSWDGKGELAPFPASTPFAQSVLAEMPATYVPYILGNRQAQTEGRKAFAADIYGEEVSYLSRPYPERSRHMILDRIENTLSEADKETVRTWLVENNLSAAFQSQV